MKKSIIIIMFLHFCGITFAQVLDNPCDPPFIESLIRENAMTIMSRYSSDQIKIFVAGKGKDKEKDSVFVQNNTDKQIIFSSFQGDECDKRIFVNGCATQIIALSELKKLDKRFIKICREDEFGLFQDSGIMYFDLKTLWFSDKCPK